MTQPTGSQLTSTHNLNRIVATETQLQGIAPGTALAELHNRANAEDTRRPHEQLMRQALANLSLDKITDVEQFNRHIARDIDEPVITRENAAWMRALALDELHCRAVTEEYAERTACKCGQGGRHYTHQYVSPDGYGPPTPRVTNFEHDGADIRR